MIQVRLSGIADISALETRWRALEARAEASFFQTWTWTGCLAAERFPDPVLAEATEDGETVGLALFNRRRGCLYLGETGAAPFDRLAIEHNGPLALRPDIAAAILRIVAARHDAVLSGLSQPAPGLVLKSQAAPFADLRGQQESTIACDAPQSNTVMVREDGPPTASLSLPPQVVGASPSRTMTGKCGLAYMDRRSANTRQQIRRSDRAFGEPTIVRAETAATAHAWLEEMAVLHQATWTARGEPGCFADPFFARFHHALIDRGMHRGEIDLWRVTGRAGTVGILYNFRFRGRTFAYQSGFAYDPADARRKPGLTCHRLAIEASGRDGVRYYDFLAGDSRYKRSLADGSATMRWVLAGPWWSPRLLVKRARDAVAGLRDTLFGRGAHRVKHNLLSTTSVLAVLALGGGRVAAAPIVRIADGAPTGVAGDSDVLRDSLALFAPRPVAIDEVLPAATMDEARPVAGPALSQSPSATYTYKAQVALPQTARDKAAAFSRRNPGNVSNLHGTIGTAREGIFAVPSLGVLINEMPARAYNYIFRPTLSTAAPAVPDGSADIAQRITPRGDPGHSVFIGVRPAVAEGAGGPGRDTAILGATGSATPTLMIESERGRSARFAGGPGATGSAVSYQLEMPLATTIGFSTRDVRPTELGIGAAGSSTLGYTYVPRLGRGGGRGDAGATLSATVAVSDDDVSLRIRPAPPATGRIATSTVGAAYVRTALVDDATDRFAVATGSRVPEQIAVPVAIKGALSDPESGVGSMLEGDTDEGGDGNSLLFYGLVAGATLVPVGGAVIGYRLIRRAALKRLTG